MIQNESSVFRYDHNPTDSSRPRAFRMVSVRTRKSGRAFLAYRETRGGWNWAAGIRRGTNSHSESVRGGGRSVHFRKWRRSRSAIAKRSTEKFPKKVSLHHSRILGASHHCCHILRNAASILRAKAHPSHNGDAPGAAVRSPLNWQSNPSANPSGVVITP